MPRWWVLILIFIGWTVRCPLAVAEDGRHLRLELRYSQMRVPLEDSHFTGQGQAASGDVIEVEATGSDAGLTTPTLEWVDFSFGAALPSGGGEWWISGCLGGGWGTGYVSNQSSGDARYLNPGALWGARAGLEFDYAYPLGWVSPYGGIGAGVRLMVVPLVGLDSWSCRGRGLRGKQCGGMASAAQIAFEPKLGLELFGNAASTVATDLFATADLLHPGNYSLGVGLAFHVLR